MTAREREHERCAILCKRDVHCNALAFVVEVYFYDVVYSRFCTSRRRRVCSATRCPPSCPRARGGGYYLDLPDGGDRCDGAGGREGFCFVFATAVCTSCAPSSVHFPSPPFRRLILCLPSLVLALFFDLLPRAGTSVRATAVRPRFPLPRRWAAATIALKFVAYLFHQYDALSLSLLVPPPLPVRARPCAFCFILWCIYLKNTMG